MAYPDSGYHINWRKSEIRTGLADALMHGTLSRWVHSHSRLFWLTGGVNPPTQEELQTNLTWDQALKLYVQQTMQHEYVLEIPYAPAWESGLRHLGTYMRNWSLALSCQQWSDVVQNLEFAKNDWLPRRKILVVTPGDMLSHEIGDLPKTIAGVVIHHPQGMKHREFSLRTDRFIAELAITGVPYWVTMPGQAFSTFDGGLYRIFDSEGLK